MGSLKILFLEDEIENFSIQITWKKWVKTESRDLSQCFSYISILRKYQSAPISDLLCHIYELAPGFLDQAYVKINQTATYQIIDKSIKQNSKKAIEDINLQRIINALFKINHKKLITARP